MNLDFDTTLQCSPGIAFNFSENSLWLTEPIIETASHWRGWEGCRSSPKCLSDAWHETYLMHQSLLFPAFWTQVELPKHIFQLPYRYKNGKETAKVLQQWILTGRRRRLISGRGEICTINVFLLLNICVIHVCMHVFTYICVCI